MFKLPRRISLVSQTADMLRSEIVQHNWQGWLPGERALCDRLQISRCTLRTALAQLAHEKHIQIVPSKGHRILGRLKQKKRQLKFRDVALLTPELLENLRPVQILWIDELRAMLSEHGCNLHLIPTPRLSSRSVNRTLPQLIRQNPHACWILVQSTAAVQEWFTRAKVDCLVAGTPHVGMKLPFRDLDHQATSRHAAGVLLGLGHRVIACASADKQLAGSIESERGFLEAVKKSPYDSAQAILVRHEGSPKGIERMLRGLMRQNRPPTGLLVSNAYHYLAAVSHCAQMGVRIPADLSVIVKTGESLLSFLTPEPTRYHISPQVMARALLRPLLDLLMGAVIVQREVRLMPDFVRGASIAAISRNTSE